MTPQSSFMILAAIDRRREDELRRLLESMNDAPGRVNPRNALIAFCRFNELHFSRLVILDDKTLDDIEIYGVRRPTYPLYLAFLGDVDGDANSFLSHLSTHAEKGLRAIFSCCEGFASDTDLLRWMKEHGRPSAASYVNWMGRTSASVHEDAALYEALQRYVLENAAVLATQSAQEAHAAIQAFVSRERAAGRLRFSAERPTPIMWMLCDMVHLIGVPLLLLLASPLLVVCGIIVFVRLRFLEKTDPEICFRTNEEYSEKLAVLGDHDVTNAFSAMGSIKPGLVRRWTASFALLLLDYADRHIYTRGRLARVRTMHFARWVFLDDKKRMLFAGNYDGSLETYMDDFINKVGFGLNVVFSNGVGYPRTSFLLRGGAKDEQKFKNFLRRHEMPTQVWYNPYSGLTAVDLERNMLLRKGVEASDMTDQEARAWAALL
jgi:hypothetical protein